ncbi:Uncharacterised protein [Legionella lansingensis]|uniref:Uncharacterized protein n=1 Tax=Legionella lansingensis TaxID=45067 RepID=A0A0W0VRW6_9GAMM|nr:hypothetical protein Llan_0984 [Legionella lansingensis]SNV53691.1 Uncharacterised protein [Legionella lansingensis]
MLYRLLIHYIGMKFLRIFSNKILQRKLVKSKNAKFIRIAVSTIDLLYLFLNIKKSRKSKFI